MRSSLVAIFVCAMFARAHAEPDRIDRVAGLARIWAEVKFFHPAMYQRAIDWDGAFVKALPEVDTARDAASYGKAIEHLLAALGDPRTGLAPAKPQGTATSKERAGDVLVLDAHEPAPADMHRIVTEARAELATAKVVVFDLRGLDDGDAGLLDWFLDALPAAPAWPLYRTIRHVGWRTQGGDGYRDYSTGWDVTPAGRPTAGATTGPRHVVVVVDNVHALAPAIGALWLAGHATIVAAGPLDEQALAPRKRIALPYGVDAVVRTADVVVPAGTAIAADVVVPRGDVRARAIDVAKAIAAGGPPPRAAARRATAGDALRIVDDDAAPAGFPSRERRLLGLVRAWAAIEYFYGIPRRLHDWDKQFRAAVPLIEAASDLDGYKYVLQEMLASLNDGHTAVIPRVSAHRASTTVYWRRIEGKLVAGGFRDPALAAKAGIALGDELIAVDGAPAEPLATTEYARLGAGTDEARRQWTVAFIDRGTRGTTTVVDVRDAAGKPHRVTLERAFDYEGNFWARHGAHFRMVNGQVGYVDLARLTRDEIDPMFAQLAAARAIVFDMRGYPQNGVQRVIANRLAIHGAAVAAEFRTPIVTAATAGTDTSVRELQFLQPSPQPYRGKVVVLIDDRAISAAEHTCLLLEAAAGAKFVGSPTTGTNGSNTYVKLPGGLDMVFTGQEVLHADGRPLQQVGIQPDVVVRPTLRGLRAGKDEVLDRALAYLATGT